MIHGTPFHETLVRDRLLDLSFRNISYLLHTQTDIVSIKLIMFRAVCDFDGSDTVKCISLVSGDQLSAVHVLDTTWYIGFNERSKQTGAFPAACVEPEEGNDYTPLPGLISLTLDLL